MGCEYCNQDRKTIFDFETLDHWVLGWNSDVTITMDNAMFSNNTVYIDRGYLRMVDVDDSNCLDHGQKMKLNYCPFCGVKLEE